MVIKIGTKEYEKAKFELIDSISRFEWQKYISYKKSPKLTCYNFKLSAYNNNVSKTNSFRLQLKMKFEADYGGNIKEIFYYEQE
jgi:hypothetical protein